MDRVHDLDATSLTTAYPTETNKVTNVPPFSADEMVPAPVRLDDSGPGRRPMLRPEQKSIKVMKRIVSKFSELGDTVKGTVAYPCLFL